MSLHLCSKFANLQCELDCICEFVFAYVLRSAPVHSSNSLVIISIKFPLLGH